MFASFLHLAIHQRNVAQGSNEPPFYYFQNFQDSITMSIGNQLEMSNITSSHHRQRIKINAHRTRLLIWARS
jgi:hypothetical protein